MVIRSSRPLSQCSRQIRLSALNAGVEVMIPAQAQTGDVTLASEMYLSPTQASLLDGILQLLTSRSKALRRT